MRAVVVGAGVIGSSVALELARSGADVTVVDRAGAAGHGSTSASSAVVRFNFSTLQGVALAWEARHCWEHWAEHLGTTRDAAVAHYQRAGMVLLDVDVAPRRLFVPLFDEVGVPYEEWDADTLAARVPGIDAGRYWPPSRLEDDRFWSEAPDRLGAVYTPDRRFPGLGVPDRPRGVVGVYDVSDDWTPIYDRTDVDGFYVAIGTSGNQFKNAPVVGQLMSTLVRAVEAGADHDREPVGVPVPHTGRVIELGAFSRLRSVNAASTGTVMG